MRTTDGYTSDDHDRRLADIEKRLARVERMLEKPEVLYGGPATHTMKGSLTARGWQFCECGRDVCRAPDCPSHKPDPLGR
jgi:hypothetical protein